MVKYFGRHGAKQHIHNKPIRFGFKVWSLCTRLGYLIQAQHYQGASTENARPHFGVGGSDVMDFVSKLPHDITYSVYVDNYFTSFRLIEELGQAGLDCTGTIRQTELKKLH